MKRVEPQLDPGSLLHAQRALHSCRDAPGLAQACVTTALNLVGFDFAILLLGRPGAWAVAACAGAAAVPSGLPANVAPSLVQRLAEQRALALDGADAVSLLGALLPLPYARRVLVHAIAGDGADAAALRGALVCGYEHDDSFAAARRQALDLIAEATAWELERLRRADELDRRTAELERHEQLLAALSAIGEVSRTHGRRSRQLISLALQRLLRALDFVDGGIYLYNYRTRDLTLAVAYPPGGFVAHQGAQLSLDERSQSIPVRAAASRQALFVEIYDQGPGARGQGSGVRRQGDKETRRQGDTEQGAPDSPSPTPNTQHPTPNTQHPTPNTQHPTPNTRFLALPLLAGARLIGVVQVVCAAGRELAESDQAALRSLARHLALAVEHTHLFDAARLAQERARALVDASNDAIMLLDSDGRAMIVNRRAKYFFGLAERDVIGRSAEQLRAMFHLIFEDGAAFDAWLTPLLASTDRRAVAEFKVLRVEPRLLQCFTAPVLDQQEDLLGRLLVFRDITREREVERMKNEFVSMVSHELRTPLTSIRGALQLVIGRAHQPELSARTSELLNVSLSNSERLIRLINDILDISKIEHGAIQLRRTAVDPAELCRAAAQEVAGYAAGRGIAVEVTAPEGAPPVSADRDRALQVLANLLSNAIKFSDPGQSVELSAASGDGVARFAVRDHGRGIAPEDHQRIFEKFQQADNSLTRDVGGTGLGLAICKALVEEHGGRIWLDSAPGQGATFTFTLPLAVSAEAPHYGPGLPASGALDAAPRHVLVVDDDDHVRPALVRLLERTGLRVSGVVDGRAALEMVRRDPPDLILLDVRMPGADGYEVLRRLKRDSAYGQIPVVILTALDSGDDVRRQALDLGAARYLEKPIASEDLLAAITSILQPLAGIR